MSPEQSSQEDKCRHDTIDMWCHICGIKILHHPTFYGTICTKCKIHWSRPDGEVRIPIYHIKKANNLTWKDIGVACGWKASTTINYYHSHPYRLFMKMLEVGILHKEENDE